MKELIYKYKGILLLILLVGVCISKNISKNTSVPITLEKGSEVISEIEEVDRIRAEEDNMEQIQMQEEIDPQTIKEVPVYICGEIAYPGVYYVLPETIISDVIELSGGMSSEADPKAINLARIIIPNEKIIVPKIGEEIDKLIDSYENRERMLDEATGTYFSATQSEAKIRLNTASREELMTLNGIGAVKADAIIAYRQEKGFFADIEEVKYVTGIGEKTFEKIKSFIAI